MLVVGTNARTFIHFSQIQGLYDESDLKTACSFALLTSQSEYRFFCETSTDYQKYQCLIRWVGALTKAFENMSKNENYRPQSIGSDCQSTISRPHSITRTSSAMSKDPEDYIEAHRTLTLTREEKRRSVSQRRGSTLSSASVESFSNDITAPPPPMRKKSLIQKIKNIFVFNASRNSSRGSTHEDSEGQEGKSKPRSKSLSRLFAPK